MSAATAPLDRAACSLTCGVAKTSAAPSRLRCSTVKPDASSAARRACHAGFVSKRRPSCERTSRGTISVPGSIVDASAPAIPHDTSARAPLASAASRCSRRARLPGPAAMNRNGLRRRAARGPAQARLLEAERDDDGYG